MASIASDHRDGRDGAENAFRRFWLAETISLVGAQLSVIALPTLAIVDLKATPLEAGLLGASAALPFPVLGLVAGAMVDRYARRPLLITANLSRAGVLFVVAVLAHAHHLTMPLLYCAAFVTGTLTLLFDVSYQSFLPSLLPRKRLVVGNARLQASASAAQTVGQPVSGAVIALAGSAFALGANAASYLAAGIILTFVRCRESRAAPGGRAALGTDIRDGIACVRRTEGLPTLFCSSAIGNLGYGIVAPLYFVYLYDVLHVTPNVVGIVAGVAGLGTLWGARMSPALSGTIPLRNVIGSTAMLVGLSYAVIPLGAAYGLWIIALSGLVRGAALTVYNVHQVTFRQQSVSAEFHGRVNATARTVTWSTYAAGNAIAGLLAVALGVPGAILAGGVIVFISAVPVVLVAAMPALVEVQRGS